MPSFEYLFSHPGSAPPSLPVIASRQTYLDLQGAVTGIEARISAGDFAGARQLITAMETLVNQAARAGKIQNTRDLPASFWILGEFDTIARQLP